MHCRMRHSHLEVIKCGYGGGRTAIPLTDAVLIVKQCPSERCQVLSSGCEGTSVAKLMVEQSVNNSGEHN